MPVVRLAFAIAAYFAFFAAFLYLIAFVGDFLVPRTIDTGPAAPSGIAAATNLALIALFGVQHSVMARPSFKHALAGTVHPAIERSVYVLASVVVLVALMALWRPIPAVVWQVEGPAAILLWAVFGLGWAIVFVSTWLLNHFELFGLQQVWFDLRGRQAAEPQFREPLFYRHVRHPLYLGFLLAFWATPTMTQGHLLFAAAMTVYVLIAIRYEERDLTAMLGERYVEYSKRVGMLIPGVGKRG
jgi:protein-S-isoprenylcysteine O-methyltransferase Ste14